MTFTYSVNKTLRRPPLATAASFGSQVVMLPSGRSFYTAHVQQADIDSLTSPEDVDALRSWFARHLVYVRTNMPAHGDLSRVMKLLLERLNTRYDELMRSYE